MRIGTNEMGLVGKVEAGKPAYAGLEIGYRKKGYRIPKISN